MQRPRIQWLIFFGWLVTIAIVLVTVPPPTSTVLFTTLIVVAILLAGLDAAHRAQLGPAALTRLALARGRSLWRVWGQDRAASHTPPLAETLRRPLPPLQFAAEILLIALVAAAVTQPYLRPGDTEQLPGGEAEWLTSSAHFAALTLRERGYIPLWQPYLEAGEPLIDNPFSFVLNPVSAGPSLLLGGVRGIKISVALTAMLAGWGGWALGRVLGFGSVGRLLLALLMTGKGNMLAMIGTGYFQLGTSQAYLPWIAAGTIALLRLPGRRWPVVLTAVMFTLLFWAGNIWYTLPALMSMGLLALTHVIRRKAGRFSVDRIALRRLLLAAVFTLGLSAVTLLPVWAHRDRIGGHPDERGAGTAVPLAWVLTQFVNDDAAQYMSGDAHGQIQFYHSFVIPFWYLLIFILLLPPILPYLYRPGLPEAWRVWLAGLILIPVFVVWGAGGNPAVAWLYDHVPLLGQWRFVGRALAGASFWIAVLVAMRIDGLWRALWRPDWLHSRRRSLPGRVTRIGQAALAALVIGLSAQAARQVNAQWHIFAGVAGINVQDAICLDWLRQERPTGELAVYRKDYDAVTPFLTHHIRLWEISADYFPQPLESTIGQLDLTRSLPEYGIAWERGARAWLQENGYVEVMESPAPADRYHCLYRREAALPYAYALPVTLLNQAPGDQLNPAIVTPIADFERAPDTIRLLVPAWRVDPIVVTIQERAYPGWAVTVDGAPAQLESAGGQVGVVLPPGDALHLVEFAYRPPLLYAGGVLTLLTAGACGLYLLHGERVIRRWQPRRRAAIPPEQG